MSFGAQSTALDVVDGLDLRGKRAIVTGASSGIGVETARALAAVGAEVTLAVRDSGAGERVARDIQSSTGTPVHVAELDLADLGSVTAFAEGWEGVLHILVNNAGIMHAPLARTAEGWESHFAVNHLGHFALAHGLLSALTSAEGARIASLSSSGHASSGIRFDDLFFERDRYDAGLAYGQSKTANVLFALEANERWADRGIVAGAVMPGGIWTRLQRHWDPAVLADMKKRYQTKSPEQGAATSVFVASRADLGRGKPVYFEDCGPANQVSSIPDGLHGVVDHALDPVAARRLWDVSLELTRH